jgi:hypothetical protein
VDVVFNPTQEAFIMKAGATNKTTLKLTLESMFGPAMVHSEYRFHPVRKWRFDYAVPQIRLAVEYNGHAGFVGKFGASGHSSITGLTRDAEKLNSAIGCGWRVLQFTALHFRQADRLKHGLRDVRTTILDALSAMQNEEENQ